MPDWVIAVAVVVGTLLGAGIQEFRRWRERRERYQVMTFPKRLEAHQQAFSWCHKLYLELSHHNTKEIHRVAQEARAWWNANCFFLDANSRRKMIPLLNAAHVYADGIESGRPGNVQPGDSIWRYLNDALKAITEGIGDKYLPETSTAEAVKQEEKETDQGGKSTAKNVWEKLKRSFFANWRVTQIFFVVGVVVCVGLIAYLSLMLPATEVVTMPMKGSFICGSVGAIIGLSVAYLEVKNKWANLALTIAIDLVLFGMLFQLRAFLT